MPDNRLTWKGLPRVDLTVTGTIDKVTSLNGAMVITNAYGSAFPTGELWNGNITIKGRGNSTWPLPKKPYNVTTANGSFAKLNTTLFGFPTHAKFSFLAGYQDKAFFRTIFTNRLSYCLGLSWAARSQQVELYMNGDYQGIYTITEKVERDVNRINITALTTLQNAEPEITGGYTIEQQVPDQLEAADKSFVDSFNKTWGFKIPDSDKPTTQQITYIQDYVNGFYNALYNVDFADLTNGYRAFINPATFAKYYLVQDISKNSDAYLNSWYYTKERGQKMDAGPLWDVDGCWGAIRNDYVPSGLSIASDSGYLTTLAPFYSKMLEDAYFRTLVADTFKAALPAIHRLLADLVEYIPQLIATGAIDRDRAKWPDLLTDELYVPTANYAAEKDRILDFIKARLYYHQRRIYDVIDAKPAIIASS